MMLQYPEPVSQNGERGTGDKNEVSQGRTCVSRNVLTGHPFRTLFSRYLIGNFVTDPRLSMMENFE